jgi:translation elongation factor P/translation initiation factor 5A
MSKIIPSQAKKIVKAELEKRNISFTKLTSRTVNFMDLTRDNCIFVKIHGWQPNPLLEEVEQVARTNGFRVETDFGIG